VRISKDVFARKSFSCQHIAVIPTAWGCAGVTWRDHATAPESPGGPCIDAVLTRILTPGLSLADLRRTLFKACPAEMGETDEVLGDAHGRFHPETVPVWFPELVAYVQAAFDDSLRHREEIAFVDVWSTWRPRLDLSALTPFQQQVLQVVSRIPRGESRTYGQIAAEAGKPGAARAAGGALRRNPFPLLIPCHRVIGSTGKMTGFTAPGGIAAKKRLLALEKPTPAATLWTL
jgi:O-6-methylguanine DNA methyltransferase